MPRFTHVRPSPPATKPVGIRLGDSAGGTMWATTPPPASSRQSWLKSPPTQIDLAAPTPIPTSEFTTAPVSNVAVRPVTVIRPTLPAVPYSVYQSRPSGPGVIPFGCPFFTPVV